MQIHAIQNEFEGKNITEPSRLEMLMEQYSDLAKAIVHQALEEAVRAEFGEFIGPRIGQQFEMKDNDVRIDYKNGSRVVKQVMIDTMALQNFRIPRNRTGGFQSTILARGKRQAGKFAKLALELFVNGVSTRKVRRAFEKSAIKLTGLSKSSVSRISKDLMQEYLKWANRPIKNKFIYLQADGVYIKTRRKSSRKAGTLMITGITESGEKEVLHFTLGNESERNFDEALQSLLGRGLDASSVRLITLDGAKGPINSVRNIFGSDRVQRCTVHKTRNIIEKCPKVLKDEIKAKLERLWKQPSLTEAEKHFGKIAEEYKNLAPGAIECLSADRDDLFRFFCFPESHRNSIRTTNLIERVIREVRRRVKVMDSLHSEKGVFGIVMGVVREQNDRWEAKSHWRES
jgi:transposase-like protein